ncbi:MAG TPA: Hsp33 family molecular chaperone HslO [Planctomycetota bacterium]|nr:Hsp33 family molecular chaperone HslO [Planctomycetota bacterium]
MSHSSAKDRILVAVTRDGRFRARAARLTSVVRECCQRHGVTGLAAEAMARALGCAAAFPTSAKDAERVTLQWSGGGPLRTVFTEARPGGFLRGFVGAAYVGEHNVSFSTRGVGHGLGVPGGYLNVLRQESSGVFTQSRTELKSGEIDEDLESWFFLSDQVPSRMRVLTGPLKDGVPREVTAILVQLLPGSGPEDLPPARVLEGMGADAQLVDLLDAAFEGRPFDVLEESDLEYRCFCARERIADGIALLDVDELLDMINEDQGASVRCEFCATQYIFNREDLEDIMVRKVTGHTQD